MSERAHDHKPDVVDRLHASENNRQHAWILRTLRDVSTTSTQMRRVTQAWKEYQTANGLPARAQAKAHLEETVQAIEEEWLSSLPVSDRVENIGATFTEAFYALAERADNEFFIENETVAIEMEVHDAIDTLESQYKLACSLAGYVEALLASDNLAKAFALLTRLKDILEHTEGYYRVLEKHLSGNTVTTFYNAVRRFDPEQNLFIFIEELEGKLEDRLAELRKK